MASQSVAGYVGRMYLSTDGGSTFPEVAELSDVEITVVTKEADATTHSSAGWEETKPTNSKWSATAKGLRVTSDAGQAAVVSALSNKTLCQFRFDPEGTTVGKPRRTGSGYITNWKETQPTSALEAADISISGTGPLTFATQ